MNILRRLATTAGIILLISPTLAHAACATAAPDPETATAFSMEVAADEIDKVDNTAIKAAVADGLTTGLALSAGALETNPLVSTTPLGLIALTGVKIALVKLAEPLPEQEKRTVIKLSSSLWGGVAVNNLLVFLAAPTPLSLLAGLLMGFYTWHHTGQAYEDADRAIAARALSTPARDEPVVVGTAALAPCLERGGYWSRPCVSFPTGAVPACSWRSPAKNWLGIPLSLGRRMAIRA